MKEIPMDKLLTVVRDGVEISAVPGAEYAEGEIILTDTLPIAHSCELSETKKTDYRAALYVTKDGVDAARSAQAAVSGGAYDDSRADGLRIESRSHDFSAVLVDGGRYVIKDAKLRLLSDADGSDTCDFVGLGAAVGAFNGAHVEIDSSEIATEGVARCTVFCDGGSDVVVKDSKLSVMGGKLYDGYVNSADFNFMVATPWVLGIMGNARGTNLMGEKSSTVLVNTDITARNWGVLSTDNGENNVLAVIDCTLTLVGGEEDRKNPYHKTYGSGYGTYILGCDEEFRGVKMRVGTYIGIAREGNAVYRSSRGPVKIVSPTTGEVLFEGEGRGEVSELHSDGFGIMAHDRAELTLTDGTIMDTQSAAFLLRSGGVHIRVEDGAKVTAADGVLLQILDDDDMSVGVNWDGDIELEFHTEFNEKEGWPSENGQISSIMPPPDPAAMPPMEEGMEPPPPPLPDVTFTAKDVFLSGALYNGSGYYGQKSKHLYVTLGAGAVLTGTISATETVHVDENGRQNTHFTSAEYYYLGRVANRVFHNGDNDVEVRLEAGSVWNVTESGLITALTVEAGAVLNGRVLVDGAAVVPEAGKEYRGRITVAP